MNAPNSLSVARILLTAPAAAAILTGHEMAALAWMAAALVTDFFDGWLARNAGRPTELGKILDPVADKIFATGVLAALVHTQRVPIELVVVVVLRDLCLLAVGWARIRGGAPVPVASLPGKFAFAILGFYLVAVVAGRPMPAWVPGLVGALYVAAGLTYAPRLPRVHLGRILKEER